MANKAYLYQHLPKCGGISFIRACEKWFPSVREATGSYPTLEQTAAFAKTRLDFDGLPENIFIHGHLVRPGIRPFERYGDHLASGRCVVLTILRDPLERAISAYFYRRKVGRDWPEPLTEWLKRGRNQLSIYLDVKEGDWRERLDRYFFVGVTEELQLSLDVFARKVGQPSGSVDRLNTSPRRRLARPETVGLFRERNRLDYQIYAYARERLHREAAEIGLG